MVFVGWFFRASDFRVWFFGQGFLSYGFSYTDFCVKGLWRRFFGYGFRWWGYGFAWFFVDVVKHFTILTL